MDSGSVISLHIVHPAQRILAWQLYAFCASFHFAQLSEIVTSEPNFAEMKGYAVLMMNYLQENRSEEAKQFDYQWPVQTMNVLSWPALVVGDTSAIVWRRDVPKHLLRKEDQDVEWSDDDWAFICMSRSSREERDEKQRLVYPGVIERWTVIQICADWHDAVREIVGNALCHVVTQPLLDNLRTKTDDEQTT